MNNLHDMVRDNKILEYEIGSRVYGTSTPESDFDMCSIFIAPKIFYLGLSKVEQVDLSFVSKKENGRNDKDAIDHTSYELRKYITLALDNNPNILDMLFTPDDKFIFKNSLGKKLISNRYLFPYQGLKQKYCGYAYSQRHKMLIKTDNYTNLNTFKKWIDHNVVNPREHDKKEGQFYSNQLLAELRELKLPFIKFHEHHALVGDINISLTDKLSKVLAKTKDRLSKVGNREELYTKHGFDVKFGMNLIRLLLEGKELLQTGHLEYPLKEREMLLDIRNGKWTKEDIISYSEQLEKEIEDIYSPLPSKPQYDKIETLLMEMIEESWSLL